MVSSFRFPFGALNAIPGVSGVDDVVILIPELGDIVQLFDERIPTDDEFIDLVVQGLEQGLENALPFGEIAGEIVDAIDGNIEIDGDDLVDNIIDGVAAVLEDEFQDITGIQIDIDDLADGIADQLDVEDIDGALVDCESVFGALSDDIADGLQAALDEILGGVEDLPEDINNLAEGLTQLQETLDEFDLPDVEDALDGFLEDVLDAFEDLPGGDLLFDPDAFLDAQLLRITDGLVDDAVIDDLEDAIEGVS